MSAYDSISTQVADLIASYTVAQSDGKVTLSEVWQLFGEAIQKCVVIAQSLPTSGSEKKAAVRQAVESFIDNVISPLDLPYVPNFVEPIVDGAVKQALMAALDGLLEAFVSGFNAFGWPGTKELPEG